MPNRGRNEFTVQESVNFRSFANTSYEELDLNDADDDTPPGEICAHITEKNPAKTVVIYNTPGNAAASGFLDAADVLSLEIEADNESVYGSELIHNGHFTGNSGANGHKDINWVIGDRFSFEDNKLKHTATGSGGNQAALLHVSPYTPITPGNFYKLTYDLVNTGPVIPSAKTGNGTAVALTPGINSATYLTAGATNHYLLFIDAHNTSEFTIDNISLKLWQPHKVIKVDGTDLPFTLTGLSVKGLRVTNDTPADGGAGDNAVSVLAFH